MIGSLKSSTLLAAWLGMLEPMFVMEIFTYYSTEPSDQERDDGGEKQQDGYFLRDLELGYFPCNEFIV